jgi:hypothetical protein
MKKNLTKVSILLALCCCFATSIMAQRDHRDDDRRTENFQVADFTMIDLNMAANVYIRQADSFSCYVEGRNCVVANMEVKVKNNTLRLRLPSNTCYWSSPTGATIHITLPKLTRLEMNGAGEVGLEGNWQGETLELFAEGAYNMEAHKLNFDHVRAELSGAGNMRLGGTAKSTTLEMSGAGNLDAYDLAALTTKCVMSGFGNLRCYASEELDAIMSGFGNISYIGRPKTVNKRRSGLGRIAAH